MIVVFTNEECVKDTPLNTYVKEKTTEPVKDLLKKCKERCIAINNEGDEKYKEKKRNELIFDKIKPLETYDLETCSKRGLAAPFKQFFDWLRPTTHNSENREGSKGGNTCIKYD